MIGLKVSYLLIDIIMVEFFGRGEREWVNLESCSDLLLTIDLNMVIEFEIVRFLTNKTHCGTTLIRTFPDITKLSPLQIIKSI
jgi:hypothetical protein